MKRAYIQPYTTEQYIQHHSILCNSGKFNSNINVGGGDEGGDPAGAF